MSDYETHLAKLGKLEEHRAIIDELIKTMIAQRDIVQQSMSFDTIEANAALVVKRSRQNIVQASGHDWLPTLEYENEFDGPLS